MMSQDHSLYWPRAIILVDMNAFFASVEQLDHPEWRGQPVAITNGLTGTCIITCSYEARAYGIATGMRIRRARELCPDLIQCPAHPERYATVSTNIMEALLDITPDVEVFSVDEAFLDVTHCQKLLGPPALIAQQVKQKRAMIEQRITSVIRHVPAVVFKVTVAYCNQVTAIVVIQCFMWRILLHTQDR